MPRTPIYTDEERKQRQKESREKYFLTEKGKAKRKEIMKNYYQRNKERIKAQRRARYPLEKAARQARQKEPSS